MTQPLTTTERKSAGKINPRIFLLALGMFALGTDAFVISGVLPVIARETGVTISLAGQLVTVFSLTYGFGAPLLAAFTGRWSPNRVLLIALGLFGISNLLAALAPTFSLLLLIRMLAGCCAATYAPLAYTAGISLAPAEKRGLALSLVILGLTIATALGVPLGTWVGEHAGWRMSFVLVASLAGTAFLILLLCGLPTMTPAAVSLKARLAPITQPRLVLILLPALLWNLGAYTVYTYIASLLQQNLHLVDISGLLIVFGVGGTVGNWLGGRLADRLGPKRPLMVSLVVLLVIESSITLLTTSLLGALLGLFLFGGSAAILFIPQQHRLLNAAPEHANVILALHNSTFYLGIAGGAALGGLALRAVPITELGWIGSICVLLAMGLFTLSLLLSVDKTPRTLETPCKQREKLLLLPE
jgi:predicted MFS family arabinose efflux permease